MPMKAKEEALRVSTQKVPFLEPFPEDAVDEELLLGHWRNPWPLSPQMKHPLLVVVVDPSAP
jgi:hypothetical protein